MQHDLSCYQGISSTLTWLTICYFNQNSAHKIFRNKSGINSKKQKDFDEDIFTVKVHYLKPSQPKLNGSPEFFFGTVSRGTAALL